MPRRQLRSCGDVCALQLADVNFHFIVAGFFAIDPFTGDVTVSHSVVISVCQPVACNLTAIARDGGGKTSQLKLQVKIDDVNNHAPKFVEPEKNVVRIAEVSFQFFPYIYLYLILMTYHKKKHIL